MNWGCSSPKSLPLRSSKLSELSSVCTLLSTFRTCANQRLILGGSPIPPSLAWTSGHRSTGNCSKKDDARAVGSGALRNPRTKMQKIPITYARRHRQLHACKLAGGRPPQLDDPVQHPARGFELPEPPPTDGSGNIKAAYLSDFFIQPSNLSSSHRVPAHVYLAGTDFSRVC